MNTYEWTDGLIAIAMRRFAREHASLAAPAEDAVSASVARSHVRKYLLVCWLDGFCANRLWLYWVNCWDSALLVEFVNTIIIVAYYYTYFCSLF